eukprot:PITA_14891
MKGTATSRDMESSVINLFHIGETLIPGLWMLGVVNAKYVHYHPIDNLRLAISLGMEGNRLQYDILFQEPKALQPKGEIVHDINLQEDAPLANIGMYRLFSLENAEIKNQVQELLGKVFIKPNTSPCKFPIMLVRKKDGSWSMCIDYRALNKITIKNNYPLPCIDDLLDSLKEAVYFSKLDLNSSYHQVRVAEQDAWNIAFKTKQGLYEWLVMPFGLTNAPATFMRVMNDVLRAFIDDFVITYLDDILVFSKTWEEHLKRVK